MKFYLTDKFHHKNEFSLRKGLKDLGIVLVNSIEKADLIYSPCKPIDISRYPKKKFIFGPHFSVFINTKCMFNNIHNNAIYIQPSEWVRKLWVDEFKYKSLPVVPYAFGVDTDTYTETKQINDRQKVLIYFKRRKQSDLKYVTDFLDKLNIDYTTVCYGKYKSDDYLKLLRESKYCIWIGCHESQGFALEEALSCNVPLLVWDVTRMAQEIGCNKYNSIKTRATSIPYWDYRCGLNFTNISELSSIYDKFIKQLHLFKPREYILENLSIKTRTEKFLQLI